MGDLLKLEGRSYIWKIRSFSLGLEFQSVKNLERNTDFSDYFLCD